MLRFSHSAVLATSVLLYSCLPAVRALRAQAATGSVEGVVLDTQKRLLSGARVSLDDQVGGRSESIDTDATGHFRFSGVAASAYLLRVKKAGYREAAEGPFTVKPGETISLHLQMTDEKVAGSAKSGTEAIEYSDEPQFTVAGVTDPSNVGGHSSNVTLPTKQALAKETAALATESPGASKTAAAKEAERRPVEAVKEYQRATEADPSEENFFAWGAELLLHRADEPAAEVFAKGHRFYPKSVRMLMGMGAAAYAQDLNDQAVRWFMEASELDPADPRPYLFLGKVQEVAKSEPKEWVAAFERFAKLQPESAQAHYFYAVALEKQKRGGEDFGAREIQLKKAIARDPQYGDAYLRLGLLEAERGELAKAVESLQEAVRYTPLPDEAHLRLAQVYRQMGETEKASKESALYNEVSEKKKQQLDRERRELGQFVYTMQAPHAGKPVQKP